MIKTIIMIIIKIYKITICKYKLTFKCQKKIFIKIIKV